MQQKCTRSRECEHRWLDFRVVLDTANPRAVKQTSRDIVRPDRRGFHGFYTAVHLGRSVKQKLVAFHMHPNITLDDAGSFR